MRYRTLIIALAVVVACADVRADQSLTGANRRLNELAKSFGQELSNSQRVEILREVADILSDKSTSSSDKEQAAYMFRWFAKPPSLVSEQQVQQLTAELSTSKERLKCEVAQTLKALGPVAESAIPALEQIAALPDHDTSEFQVIHALGALAEIDPQQFGESSQKQLVARLKHKENWVRWTAAGELSTKSLDSPEVRRALRQALEDDSVSVRVVATNSLCKLGEAPDDKIVSVLSNAITGKTEVAYIKPPYLSEPHRTSRKVALGAVGLVHEKLGYVPQDLQTALRTSLASSDFETRFTSLAVVKKTELTDPATIAVVQQMARGDENEHLRLEAAEWLKKN